MTGNSRSATVKSLCALTLPQDTSLSERKVQLVHDSLVGGLRPSCPRNFYPRSGLILSSHVYFKMTGWRYRLHECSRQFRAIAILAQVPKYNRFQTVVQQVAHQIRSLRIGKVSMPG